MNDCVQDFLEKPSLMMFVCFAAAGGLVGGIASGFYVVAMAVFATEGRIFFN